MILRKRNNYLSQHICLRKYPLQLPPSCQTIHFFSYGQLLPQCRGWEWLSPCKSVLRPFNGNTWDSRYLLCPSTKPSLVSTARVYGYLSSHQCMWGRRFWCHAGIPHTLSGTSVAKLCLPVFNHHTKLGMWDRQFSYPCAFHPFLCTFLYAYLLAI